MATPIRLTEKIKEELLEEVKKSLEAALLVNGKVSIEQAYTYKNKKAKLIFTPSAALKMFLLVNDASEEIGWHGLVERIDDVTW